jgi:hypothetical protein
LRISYLEEKISHELIREVWKIYSLVDLGLELLESGLQSLDGVHCLTPISEIQIKIRAQIQQFNQTKPELKRPIAITQI